MRRHNLTSIIGTRTRTNHNHVNKEQTRDWRYATFVHPVFFQVRELGNVPKAPAQFPVFRRECCTRTNGVRISKILKTSTMQRNRPDMKLRIYF